jgi:hypothetical protein
MVCAAMAAAVGGVMPTAAHAQLATGDSRTVTEPTFPTVCTQVQADLSIAGGEPSSELNTATDTANIQTALSGCAAGEAVELVANGTNDAFVIAPIAIPPGVTLLVDGGVTVFASRNPADYQIGTASSNTTCGTVNTTGSDCYALISLGQKSVGGTTGYTGANVTGIMGYGVINGRGADKLISISAGTVTTQTNSWWDLASMASGSNVQDSPIMVSLDNIVNAQLYKITILNSPHFHVKLQGKGSASQPTDFTVWGIKLLAPFTAHNTDGIDPTGVVNMSVINSVIGDGDDESAISGSSLSENFTYNNLLLTSGHGLSIGSITKAGVSNVLVNGANFEGQATDSNAEALRIKSYCSNGGAVSQVTYENVCIQNVAQAIDLDPYYDATTSTTSCPAFGTSSEPITFSNVYVLTKSGINLQGLSNSAVTNTSNITLNNVFVDAATLDIKTDQSNDTTATPAYDAITLTGNYYPAALGTLNTATNATSVTEVNNGTLAAAFPASACSTSFPTLVGELYANSTSGGKTTNNVNQAFTVTIPASITLNAMVEPVNPETSYSYSGVGSYTGVAAPTANVAFYDGTQQVGTGTLGANGTLAAFTITNPAAGTHTYTAQYLGDANYPAMTLGSNTTGTEAQSITVTVNAGPAAQLSFSAAPAASIVYGNGPGTVTVALKDAAGDATASTASVTLTVTGPNSYTASYMVNAVNGTATFGGVANPSMVGGYTYTATSGSLAAVAAGEQVTAATLTVVAQPARRIFDQPNPAFSYTITGYVNGDGSSVVSGAPVLTTTALPNSPAGNYPIAIDVTTLSATNYVFAGAGSTLSVNGGAPQIISFSPLPAFAPGSYALTATASSGLPVTYAVSGPASVNGSTLTVTGAGLVTVTASSVGNGDYAAAANVQQSFTAP